MPLPKPNPDEKRQAFVDRFMSDKVAIEEFPDEKQRFAVASSEFRNKNKVKERFCLQGFKLKEGSSDDSYTALVATTHPDRVMDILSVDALNQITNYINDNSKVGSQNGHYRGLSLFHDWIHADDPTLDEAGFMSNARVVELDDGHHGVEVDVTVNKYYQGTFDSQHYDADRIHYEIQHDKIGGLSIEYNTDWDHSREVSYNGETYRFIEELTDFAGAGFARSRMIANPQAVVYKEFVAAAKKKNKSKEDVFMSEEINNEVKPSEQQPVVSEAKDSPTKKEADSMNSPQGNAKKVSEEEEEELKKKAEEKKEVATTVADSKELQFKQFLSSKEFKTAVENVSVAPKVLKTKEEENKMSLSVKEMNKAIESGNMLSFKSAAKKYFKERPEIDSALTGHGIPIKAPSVEVVCDGKELRIVGGLNVETKDTLDTGSNPSTYVQASVEFNDIFVPGLVETFNQRTDLFSQLEKRDHIMGTPNYGWRITEDQKTGLSVDIDNPTVAKSFAEKGKLQTPLKEYRNGISVTDFMILHTRASMGDLFMVEADKAMKDLRKDINRDLFTEQVDDTTKILGLEAVADSAGNTTLYGKTRSAANRLAPDAPDDTYQEVGGALTTELLREAYSKVWVEGAEFNNLRMVMSPTQRKRLFELQDAKQDLFREADFGFSGALRFDGIPIIVDSDCQNDAIYVVDFESYYVVMSRMPQLVGLAKVSAAEEAYVVTNLAVVYEQPRRIFMLNTLTV